MRTHIADVPKGGQSPIFGEQSTCLSSLPLSDKLGRLTADKVTTLGTNVDGAVRRIERAYEARGLLEKVSSYDAASAGDVVNEVLREYNHLEMLAKEYNGRGFSGA